MEFSTLRLTRKELKSLKASAKHKIRTTDAPRLLKLGLVYEITEHVPGYKSRPTGQAEISDRGRDYLIYHTSEVRRTIVLPIAVSALTALAVDGLQWLLPMIPQLLSKIPA